MTVNGGFGLLYGPNRDGSGNDVLGEGKIAGKEYVTFLDDGTGRHNVTLLLQVPSTFAPRDACIVTATASGSRGIYGAVATAGEWGLKHGCAVAYTDKGTGIGIHDLESDTVNLIDGTRQSRALAGARSHFTAILSDEELAAFKTSYPNRVAFKHAHSQNNPEKDWGPDTLNAIALAFYVLNEQFGTLDATTGKRLRDLRSDNTLVIASSISNGGGSALAAAEADVEGWIDGVVVSEPQAQSGDIGGLAIQEGANLVPGFGKSFADYVSHAAIYAPCAILSPDAKPAGATLSAQQTLYATNRCTALQQLGLVEGSDSAAQANDAVGKLVAWGWTQASRMLLLSHVNYFDSLAMGYVNAYGRFGVQDNICGYSYAATDAMGQVVPYPPDQLAVAFASNNGIPDVATAAALIYNPSVGGARRVDFAVSPTSGLADRALDGALCLRGLVMGKDAVYGTALSGDLAAQSARVQSGIAEVQRSGNLRGKPTLVLQGRSDCLLPPNNSARAYFAKTQHLDPAASNIRYYEIENGQHLDVLLANPATKLDAFLLPMHPYFVQAMDLMYEHLKHGGPLAPSQLVRTHARGGMPGAATPIDASNVPAIALTPANEALITFQEGKLSIPQ